MKISQSKYKPILPAQTLVNLSATVQSYIQYLELTVEQQQSQLQELQSQTQGQKNVIQHQQVQIKNQQSHIEQLQAQVEQLQAQVKQLQAWLSKNSSNSSKPPSSDGPKRKPKSQRGKTGKKPGGQKGHAGKGLKPVENPDQILTHGPETCHECGFNLTQQEGYCVEKRQVFDIPIPKIEVTEHQILEKTCPHCHIVSRGVFPTTVTGFVQYGGRAKALISYLSHYQLIPLERMSQFCQDVFNLPVSTGTCAKIEKKLFEQLEVFEQALQGALLKEAVLHFDETGTRCEKKSHWLHVASTSQATLYALHAKRGKIGMDAMGILPKYKGIAIHDEWGSYFRYKQILHGLCNAHILRELTFIEEVEQEPWAKKMKALLIKAKEAVSNHKELAFLPEELRTELEATYKQIIQEGLTYHAGLQALPKAKRGKNKQRPGKNLLDRLLARQESVLRFMHDFRVSFTNNQAEQDIRMMKVKQKISGCFRTLLGGKHFCRIRSYTSTARKQGWNILEALTNAIRGDPNLLTSA